MTDHNGGAGNGPDGAPVSPRVTPRWQGITAWVLLAVAGVLLPVSLIARWGEHTLVDTSAYLDTVGPLAADPVVRQALSDELTRRLTEKADVAPLVEALAPERPLVQQVLTPSLQAVVEGAIARGVDRVIDSPILDEAWRAANEVAQRALIRVLTADGGAAVSMEGEQVILDTGDLFVVVRDALVERGLGFVEGVQPPPVVDRQIVLLESEQLATARTVYAFAQPIARFLVFVVIAMLLAAVALAPRRRSMVTATGVVVMIAGGVIWLALDMGYGAYRGTFAGTALAPAERIFFTALTENLAALVPWLLVLGAAVIAGNIGLNRWRAVAGARTAR